MREHALDCGGSTPLFIGKSMVSPNIDSIKMPLVKALFSQSDPKRLTLKTVRTTLNTRR
jgi:hypothetical protein